VERKPIMKKLKGRRQPGKEYLLNLYLTESYPKKYSRKTGNYLGGKDEKIAVQGEPQAKS
jgi:hypothetical protein